MKTRDIVLILICLASGQLASAQTIYFEHPTKYDLSDSVLNISCMLVSPLEVISVVAEVEGRKTDLTYENHKLVGSLPLVGVRQDTLTLTVTATDIQNKAFAASVDFIYDSYPLIIFDTPLLEQVAMPFVEIKARCKELDGSACSLSTRSGFELDPHYDVMQFADQIDTVLNLTRMSGSYAKLSVIAKDTRGQTTTVTINIPVENSPFLKKVTEFDQPILTVEDGRVITSGNNKLSRCDLNSGDCNEVVESPNSISSLTFLENGLAFATDTTRDLTDGQRIYSWSNGVLQQIDEGITRPFLPSQIIAYGSKLYVQGCHPPCGTANAIWMIDSNAGITEKVVSNAFGTFNVADNGSVLYNVATGGRLEYDIWSYENGIHKKLVTDGLINIRPFEGKMAYLKYIRNAVAVFDGTTENIIHDDAKQVLGHGRFVFFTATGNLGQDHVWTLDLTTGIQKQVSFFGSNSSVRATSPEGDMILSNDIDRYLASSQSVRKKIRTSHFGREFYSEGNWYVAIDKQLFIVDTTHYTKPSMNSMHSVVENSQTLHLSSVKFETAYSGDGTLKAIQITSLPESGTLTLNGQTLAENDEISRWLLSEVRYEPLDGFHGVDQFSCRASNGFDWTEETNYAIEVFPPAYVTSAEDSPFVNTLELFPNPARTKIFIRIPQISDDMREDAQLSITTTYGATIETQYAVEGDHLVAEIRRLQAGIYLARILVGKKLYTKKFLVTTSR